MGSVETQEHLPAKPHGPAHTDLHTQTHKGLRVLATGSGPTPTRCGRKAWNVPSLLHLSLLHSAKVGDSPRELVPAGFAFIDILVLFILSRKFASSITLAGSTSSQGIKHLQIGVFVFFLTDGYIITMYQFINFQHC